MIWLKWFTLGWKGRRGGGGVETAGLESSLPSRWEMVTCKIMHVCACIKKDVSKNMCLMGILRQGLTWLSTSWGEYRRALHMWAAGQSSQVLQAAGDVCRGPGLLAASCLLQADG